MTNSKINWPLFGSIVSTIAGIAGTVLTPIYGSTLTASVEGVLQAVSGLLAALGAFHVGTVAVAQAKSKIALKAAVAAKKEGVVL